MGQREDLTGRKFGRLTAIRFDGMRGKGRAFWEFECECGGRVVTRLSRVKCGGTVSCGCARRGERNAGPLTRMQQYRRDWRMRSVPKPMRRERWQANFRRLVQSTDADLEWAAAYLAGQRHQRRATRSDLEAAE